MTRDDQQLQRDSAIDKLFRSLWTLLRDDGCQYEAIERLFRSSYESVERVKEDHDGHSKLMIDPVRSHMLGEILAVWHDNEAFVDALGNPKLLAARDGRPSFVDVYNLAARSHQAAAEVMAADEALERLCSVRAVEMQPDESVKVLRYGFPIKADTQSGTLRYLAQLSEFAGTLAYNATTDGPSMSLNVATVTNVDVATIPMVNAMLNDHGMVLLRQIHDFLKSHQIDESHSLRAREDVCVGMYVALKTRSEQSYEPKTVFEG